MFTITNDTTEVKNILYLLEIDLDDKKVLKFGITSRKIEDRVCEILTSVFKSYRYFPRIYPKRFRRVENNYEKEQQILSYLSEYKYVSEQSFGGHTELVEMDLDIAVSLYEQVEKGVVLIEEGPACDTCGKVKKFEYEGRACCGHGH